MALQLTLIDTCEKLTGLETEWDLLAGENPFLGFDWVQTWWRHYQTPRVRLFTLAVRDEASQLVGLAPLKVRQTATRGRVVRFIGSNEVCGDRLTILAKPEHRVNVLQTIARWLAADARDAWDLLELTGVEQSNLGIAEFTAMLADLGHQTHIRPDLHCWKISLPKTWEGYLKMLSKPRRNRSRRMLKNTIDAGKARCFVASAADFEHGFKILVDLHQKRRNELGEPGCFTSERYHAFHQEFAKRMLARGRLRLSWVEFNNRPAAVEYNLLGDKTIFSYQSGFDPAFANQHPGWLKLVETLRWATGEGYGHFDLLRGDEPYKESFGGEPSPLMQVRIVGQHSSARLRHAAWRTQTTLKRWARQGLRIANALQRPSEPATSKVHDDEATADA